MAEARQGMPTNLLQTIPTEFLQVFSSLGREIYVRSMLPTRNGLPMWMPETYDDGPDGGANGVMIGDVGLLTEDCFFNVLFNLCHPTNDILNTHFHPPDGFEPLHLDDSDVEVTPLYFKEGAIVTSAGVDVHCLEDDSQYALPFPT